MPSREPAAVLYCDAHYLALAKPAGLPTTARDGETSLFSAAKACDPQAPQLHPLSRLDTQVTGLVVFARTARANQWVLAARRAGTLQRRYLALALDAPELSEGDWHAAIGIDPRDVSKRRALAPDAQGAGVKAAHTHFVVRGRAGPLMALDLFPRTGRTHQLRVHMAHAGHQILGDVAYGGHKRMVLANGRIVTAGRVMLHCAEVVLPSPDDPVHPTLRLTRDPEPDMVALWSALGGDPAALKAADCP